MKIVKGDYPGASTMAQLDRPIAAITGDQFLTAFLESLLNQASPGEENAEIIYNALRRAEEAATQ